MRVAIPVDEKRVDSTVCISFGRTPYFMVYDLAIDSYDFFDNAAAASQGGAGVKAAQSIVDKKVDALLTPRCGENAAVVFAGAGVKLFKTEGTSIAENIEKFKAGRLSVLSEIHAGFHHHGK